MSFQMGVSGELLRRLADLPWWKDLLEHRDYGQPIFIGIRNGYLSAYLKGKAVFKEISINRSGRIVGRFDRRYWFGPEEKKGDILLEGTTFSEGNGSIVSKYDGPISLLEHIERVKGYGLVNIGDDELSSDAVVLNEKECLAARVSRPSTINLEMALPSTDSLKRIATRIDVVHLEGGDKGVKLVFTEAKLFSNTKSLRVNGEALAPVVEQIATYRRYLEDHSEFVINAYIKAIQQLASIRERQGVAVSPLLRSVIEKNDLKLDADVRLLIFRTNKTRGMSEADWMPHRKKLHDAGITVEEVEVLVENGALIERPWKADPLRPDSSQRDVCSDFQLEHPSSRGA